MEKILSHSPIFTKFKVANIDSGIEQIKKERRVNWSKASEQAKQNYIQNVSSKLCEVEVPSCVNCSDLHCKDHTEELESYSIDVLEAVEKVAQECLPFSGGVKSSKTNNIIPGWTEYVKPFSEESKFWFSV